MGDNINIFFMEFLRGIYDIIQISEISDPQRNFPSFNSIIAEFVILNNRSKLGRVSLESYLFQCPLANFSFNISFFLLLWNK